MEKILLIIGVFHLFIFCNELSSNYLDFKSNKLYLSQNGSMEIQQDEDQILPRAKKAKIKEIEQIKFYEYEFDKEIFEVVDNYKKAAISQINEAKNIEELENTMSNIKYTFGRLELYKSNKVKINLRKLKSRIPFFN